ncbi:hypothetical protein DN745_16130 [Bradymonas sediminis]|uniref:Uncharacterized protein n=1 Tax=Bradymonas sediminis TaxID=1548548 RepID=A0A2Z4FPE3_9DELT|nr:hypothetical protein DN745_16130 [Bradymonas sediminis]
MIVGEREFAWMERVPTGMSTPPLQKMGILSTISKKILIKMMAAQKISLMMPFRTFQMRMPT